jgi:hypothetical protein
MPTKSVEQMNDGGWYATGYLTWSFRDYWWWNQKLIVVHGVVKRWQLEGNLSICVKRHNLLLNDVLSSY